MPANPHLVHDPLRAGPPLAAAAAVAILVHGRGQRPEGMLDLARRLALADTAYVLPVADERTWYPQRFTEPVEANEPRLSLALEAFDAVLAGLAGEGWPAERLALVGFSQGACLALEYVARRPRRYGGLAALTGGLIGADSRLTRPADGALQGTAVLITTRESDAWVPADRSRASAAILAAAGARVDLRILPPGNHGVSAEEVGAVRRLIRALSSGGAG